MKWLYRKYSQGIHFRGCGIVQQTDEVALTKMVALGFVRSGLV